MLPVPPGGHVAARPPGAGGRRVRHLGWAADELEVKRSQPPGKT